VKIAEKESRRLEHFHIGTEHLLLGLSLADGSVSSHVLQLLNVRSESLREAVRDAVELDSHRAAEPAKQIPFTPRAKKVLELALREALSLGHNYIGTEHILLGLARENEGVAAEILSRMGVEQAALRDATLEAMSGPEARLEGSPSVSRRSAPKIPVVDDEPSAEDQLAPRDDDERIESVPTHQDQPTDRDELGRARLAAVLAERIRRVRGENTEGPILTWWQRRQKKTADKKAAREAGRFLVHVYAPWGAGKSSLLNFLASELRNRAGGGEPTSRTRRLVELLLRPRSAADPSLSQWIIVEFSAWEHQRLVAPWWWLLVAIQRSCARELWRMNRGRWLWFWARDIAWRVWNARAAVITVVLLGSLLAIADLFDWFGLADKSLSTVSGLVLSATAAIALAGTLLGIARGVSKWLAIGSADGAVRFLKRAHDPLGVYRRRLRWLVRSSGRPITVFIDDLDRCRPEYVVELLEGIQTLFATEPVTYVVAADRNWLCDSFATAYCEFVDSVNEPGRPLGFLFLEKTFQISLEIPPMSSGDRGRYWGSLRRIRRGALHRNTGGSDLGETLANASTQAEVQKGVGELLERGHDEDDVLEAAVRRLNAPELERHEGETLLDEFAPLVENNPRSMKRLMNAYGIERDRILRDGHMMTRLERQQLALLTILRLRWPLFADHLRIRPEDVRFCVGDPPTDDNEPYADLYRDPDLRRLFDGSVVKARLDAELLAHFPRQRPARPQAGLGSPARSA
jgi:hypothetical protein